MELKTIMIGGTVAIVALSFIPFALPSSVRVERSATIDATPAQLFELVASNEGFQTFNPYKDTDPDLKITLSGPKSGIGSGFAFDGKEGKGTQFVTAVEPERTVTMQIDLGRMGQPVQTFRFDPKGDATQVTWQVDMEFGMNPIGRVFGLFMDGMLGKTYERGLANLANAVSKSA